MKADKISKKAFFLTESQLKRLEAVTNNLLVPVTDQVLVRHLVDLGLVQLAEKGNKK